MIDGFQVLYLFALYFAIGLTILLFAILAITIQNQQHLEKYKAYAIYGGVSWALSVLTRFLFEWKIFYLLPHHQLALHLSYAFVIPTVFFLYAAYSDFKKSKKNGK